MTDKEMLAVCQVAFEAIPVAGKARKMLRKMEREPAAYAGNGSHSLAQTMAEMINEHLKGGQSPLPKPKDTITAFAAWHPVKGFDEHHYEGPIAFADLDDEGGVIEVVKDLNQTEGTTEWRAVKVEIKRVA